MQQLRRIAIVSARGGAGASAVTANLASALARSGKRVLVSDLSVNGRWTDYYLGVRERVVYDLSDLAEERTGARDVCVRVDELYDLYVVPGVLGDELPPPDVVARCHAAAVDATSPEFLLLDISGSELLRCRSLYDEVLVVTDESTPSLAGATRAASRLREAGVTAVRLLINRFTCGAGKYPVSEMIDRAGIPLAGIVPRDDAFGETDEGKLLFTVAPASPAAAAYVNIARRISGRRVRLLDGIPSIRRERALGI